MALSNKTYQNLAKALQDEVAEYIRQDERYMDFMMELVPDAIQNKLGFMNDEVLMELSMCVLDKLDISPTRLNFD
jgi:predicted house-cleaning noncanonical NTP pyrophosphatase (MazG superfamily)